VPFSRSFPGPRPRQSPGQAAAVLFGLPQGRQRLVLLRATQQFFRHGTRQLTRGGLAAFSRLLQQQFARWNWRSGLLDHARTIPEAMTESSDLVHSFSAPGRCRVPAAAARQFVFPPEPCRRRITPPAAPAPPSGAAYPPPPALPEWRTPPIRPRSRRSAAASMRTLTDTGMRPSDRTTARHQ